MSHQSLRAPDNIKEKIDDAIARLIGVVAVAIGLLGVGLVAWATYMVAQLEHPTWGAFFLIGGFLVVAVFFLRVGWRLLFNRPNRFGSIFGPLGWGIWGVAFALLAATMLVFSAHDLALRIDVIIERVLPIIGSVVFSYWCFKSGKRAKANASSKGAP